MVADSSTSITWFLTKQKKHLEKQPRSNIGPKFFPAATSVATLKENIIAQWPKEKENGPRTVKDIMLISAGRILENNRTVEECRSPLYDIPGVVTTMHVVVQPPAMEVKKPPSDSKQNKCVCMIL
ncbi:Membrane-anchored ubiquitin-fold protein 2 [Forsythia ovata]|uniref:Membrane-anchored ubiquitin-fold protein 2 n=1 Tax=Forsythia ovata TaxID=205694 RepID=A0ABD1UDP5_9LAMI